MASNAAGAPLTVGLFGVSERSRHSLELLFKLHGKGQFCLAGDDSPNAAIVDMDGPHPQKLWAEYRTRYPNLPTIVMSVREESHPHAVTLLKPLKPQQVLEVLSGFQRALAELGRGQVKTVPPPEPRSSPETEVPSPPDSDDVADATEQAPRRTGLKGPTATRAATAAMEKAQEGFDACGDAEDIDLTNTKLLPSIYFSGEHRLLALAESAMRAARASGQIQMLAIDGLEHPLIFLPEGGGSIIARLSLKHLRFFSLVPLADRASAMVSLRGIPPDLADRASLPFDRFLWSVTMWTSRGRLPTATPLEVPVRLKRWPNFTRVLETPHALRIAALWTRNPHCLLRTGRILDVPQRYVFTFFSAVEALGLIEWLPDYDEDAAPEIGAEHRGPNERRHEVARATPSAREGDRRGLLGRILSHLLGKP